MWRSGKQSICERRLTVQSRTCMIWSTLSQEGIRRKLLSGQKAVSGGMVACVGHLGCCKQRKTWVLRARLTKIRTYNERANAASESHWPRASLVAQWLRVRPPMQGTRVRALVWEDPTCRGATGPVSHNCWACASGACAPHKRGRDSERPAHRDEEWPPLAATRESPRTEMKTQHSQK